MKNNISYLHDCSPYEFLNRIPYQLKLKNIALINRIRSQIDLHVPHMTAFSPHHRSPRSKSAWERFLNYMNIGTANDVETIYKNLVQLQTATQKGFDAFRSAVEGFHSYTTAANRHAQEVTEALTRQHNLVISLASQTNAAVSFLLKLFLHQVDFIDASQQPLHSNKHLSCCFSDICHMS